MNHINIATFNINSLRYKFDQLKLIIQEYVDILVVQETKIDLSFPKNQFDIDGFSQPFRLDKNLSSGGVMIFIRDTILATHLNDFKIHEDVEGMFIELNLKGVKWLIFGTYRNPKQCHNFYFSQVSKALEFYSEKYDNFLLVGDFNFEIEDKPLKDFLINHGLSNIVKDKTCYKNPQNPSCIDLIITNKPLCFQNTKCIDIGLSDFHLLVVSSFKAKFDLGKPKLIL